jgi:hypothetical protein
MVNKVERKREAKGEGEGETFLESSSPGFLNISWSRMQEVRLSAIRGDASSVC